MWLRGLVGVLCCLVGGVWIAQGTNAIRGSGMSGHGQYAILGGVLVVVGVALMVWAWSIRRARSSG